MLKLTDDDKRQIWDILVAHCGASEEMRPDFNYHFPDCGEFRFQGALGFGGKIYADPRRVWVSCYSEDESPDRKAMIKDANHFLAAFGANR